MPVKSGIDYLPEVVAKYPQTAVVMLTGIGDTSIAVTAMREGAYDYITKPVELSEFINALQRALERRAKALETQQYQTQLERLVAQRTDDLEQRNHEIFTLNAQFQKSLNKGISIQQAYQEAQGKSPFGSFKI